MFGFGKSVKSLSPPEVQTLAARGDIHLVDVREAGEWASGRIGGAVHMPLSSLPQTAGQLPADKQVAYRAAEQAAQCSAARAAWSDAV